jgi:hypothetical protein
MDNPMWDINIVCRIPTDAKQLRLIITGYGWEQNLLIGDENSLGHKKTFLATPTSGPTPTANLIPEFSSSFLHD